MDARLKNKLRLIAIQRSDLEGHNVTLEEVHNDVLRAGMPVVEASVREATKKAAASRS